MEIENKKQDYKLLNDIINLLKDNGILYWADGPTLLDAVNKEPIQNTIELSVICSCGESPLCAFHDGIPELFESFETLNYYIVCSPDNELINIFNENDNLVFLPYKCFIDEKNNDITEIMPKHKKHFPNRYYDTCDLFPLSERDCGEYKICIPRNPFNYLDKNFEGWKDWRKK